MKKTIAIFLIALYSLMLIVSYVPYMIYFGQQFMVTEDIVVLTDSDSKTLVGDACYLNALIKRSVKADSKEKKAPPPPPNDISENIYIYSKNANLNNLILSEDFNFKGYMISIKETFLEIDIPPPKKLS